MQDKSQKVEKKENKKIDAANKSQIGAPLQGLLSKLLVNKGEAVKKNQPLFVIEAMKMETVVTAPGEGKVGHIELAAGTLVNTHDFIIELN